MLVVNTSDADRNQQTVDAALDLCLGSRAGHNAQRSSMSRAIRRKPTPDSNVTPFRPRAALADSPWRGLGPRGGTLGIEDFPSLMLTRLGAIAKWKITKQYVEPFGLSLPEWLLIALLARYPSFTHRQIRERTVMDKGQISTTLRVLKARGLVGARPSPRAGAHRTPRAGGAMVLTPKGRALYRRVLPAAREAQMRLLKFFDEAERVQLYALLRKMLTTLEGMEGSSLA